MTNEGRVLKMKSIFIVMMIGMIFVCSRTVFSQGPEDDPGQNYSLDDPRDSIQNPGDTANPPPVTHQTINSDPAAGGYSGPGNFENPQQGNNPPYNQTSTDPAAGGSSYSPQDPYFNRGSVNQGPDGRPIEEARDFRGPMVSTGDIVLDYRSLVQRIDDMRMHEDDVIRKLEDLSRNYEDGLKKLDDMNQKLEAKIKEIQDWYEKVSEKMEKINSSWSEPQEIKGEVRGAPSDRYSSQ